MRFDLYGVLASVSVFSSCFELSIALERIISSIQPQVLITFIGKYVSFSAISNLFASDAHSCGGDICYCKFAFVPQKKDHISRSV